MTNGGKSTLSQSLHQQIPNSCIIAQDSYFKVEVFLSRKSCQGFFSPSAEKLRTLFIHQDESEVPEDSHGFKQYDCKGWEKHIKTLYHCSICIFFCRDADSHSRVLFECWTRFTWTRWWATLIRGEEIQFGSWGRGVWGLLMNSCLCWSWKVSSFSTTGFTKLLIVPNLSNCITSLWLCVSPLRKRIWILMDL